MAKLYKNQIGPRFSLLTGACRAICHVLTRLIDYFDIEKEHVLSLLFHQIIVLGSKKHLQGLCLMKSLNVCFFFYFNCFPVILANCLLQMLSLPQQKELMDFQKLGGAETNQFYDRGFQALLICLLIAADSWTYTYPC